MVTKNQHTNNSLRLEKNAGTQAFEILLLAGEILFLILQFIYFNIEAVYRAFVPPPKKSINGEIVLVTGAGHGIGKQLALQYAALGATVIAWDINEKNNEETVKEIKKNGSKAYSYICDVTNRKEVFETVDKVKKDVGNITIIVNNAGIMPTHTLLQHTQEEIENVFKINVFAHFWILQAILPSMLKRNHGHIMSISSCVGLFGTENLVPYCGTKFAVRGYMEALLHELIKNPNCQIKTTTIFPYAVNTGLCKRPRFRFGKMEMLPPEVVAERAIDAQQRDLREVTVPWFYWYMNNICRAGAEKASLKLKEFLGVSLDSDL